MRRSRTRCSPSPKSRRVGHADDHRGRRLARRPTARTTGGPRPTTARTRATFSTVAKFDVVVPIVIETPGPVSPVNGSCCLVHAADARREQCRRPGPRWPRGLLVRSRAGPSVLARSSSGWALSAAAERRRARRCLNCRGTRCSTGGSSGLGSMEPCRLLVARRRVSARLRAPPHQPHRRHQARPDPPDRRFRVRQAVSTAYSSDPRAYFFALIGRAEGSPAGDWASVLLLAAAFLRDQCAASECHPTHPSMGSRNRSTAQVRCGADSFSQPPMPDGTATIFIRSTCSVTPRRTIGYGGRWRSAALCCRGVVPDEPVPEFSCVWPVAAPARGLQ